MEKSFDKLVRKNSITERFKEILTGSKLDLEQYSQFAWICAIRALPFLSAEKLSSYWPTETINHDLLNIFTAIDISALFSFSGKDDIAGLSIAGVSNQSYKDVNHSLAIMKIFGELGKHEETCIGLAIRSVCSAIYATKCASVRLRYDARGAAANAASMTIRAAGYYSRSGVFEEVLLDDLDAIKLKQHNSFNTDVTMYGDAWYKFLDELEDIGSRYWADWLERLYKNKFHIDIDELLKRLNAPKEVRQLGLSVMGRYVDNIEDVEHLNEARIFILGEKGAGKTSLCKKLHDLDAQLPQEYESTEGVEISLWKILDETNSNNDISAHLWDFAGHTITHAVHRCFMSSDAIYIYVYNGRTEHSNRPEYWLEQVKMYGGKSPVFFLINIRDKHIPQIERKALKNEYPNIVDFYEVDLGAMNKDKLSLFKDIVKETIKNNLSWNKNKIPPEIYDIKNHLRYLFHVRDVDYITQEEFYTITKQYNPYYEEEYDVLLQDLKVLGICIQYDSYEMRDFNHLILNPDWIVQGIYRVINWGISKKKYMLSIDDGKLVFNTDEDKRRYPTDKIRFLYKLMKEYELAFFTHKNEDRVFIPLLLPFDAPDVIPRFDSNDQLTMIFEVKTALPPNVASRIIVLRNYEITDPCMLWRKGACLNYCNGDAIALITENSRTIKIQVQGRDRTAFLAELRNTVCRILNSYENLRYELLYRLIIPNEIQDRISDIQEEDLFALSTRIDSHLDNGVDYLLDKGEIFVTLAETANLYAIHRPHGAQTETQHLRALIAELSDLIDLFSDTDKTPVREALQAYLSESRKKSPNAIIVQSVSEYLLKASISDKTTQLIGSIYDKFTSENLTKKHSTGVLEAYRKLEGGSGDG